MARLTLAAAVLLAGGLLALHQLGYPFERVVNDPNSLAGQRWWVGGLSQLGLLAWGVSTACFGCAAWVRRAAGDALGAWRFLALTALILAAVAVDDALVVHEQGLARGERALQVVQLAGYAGLTAAWALRFRSELRARPLMLTAFACLGTSLALDVFNVFPRGAENVAEEYLKYVGLTGLVFAGVGEVAASARLSRSGTSAATRSAEAEARPEPASTTARRARVGDATRRRSPPSGRPR
jgi:hypothetical protein